MPDSQNGLIWWLHSMKRCSWLLDIKRDRVMAIQWAGKVRSTKWCGITCPWLGHSYISLPSFPLVLLGRWKGLKDYWEGHKYDVIMTNVVFEALAPEKFSSWWEGPGLMFYRIWWMWKSRQERIITWYRWRQRVGSRKCKQGLFACSWNQQMHDCRPEVCLKDIERLGKLHGSVRPSKHHFL